MKKFRYCSFFQNFNLFTCMECRESGYVLWWHRHTSRAKAESNVECFQTSNHFSCSNLRLNNLISWHFEKTFKNSVYHVQAAEHHCYSTQESLQVQIVWNLFALQKSQSKQPPYRQSFLFMLLYFSNNQRHHIFTKWKKFHLHYQSIYAIFFVAQVYIRTFFFRPKQHSFQDIESLWHF